MLILLEGPDEARTEHVAEALKFHHETLIEVWPDGGEDGLHRFDLPGYLAGSEPSVLLRGWHWTSVVVNPAPPFTFKQWKALEAKLGRQGALAVYAEPPTPDPEWNIVVEGSRLPLYRLGPETNLNLASSEILALAHLLEDRSTPGAA